MKMPLPIAYRLDSIGVIDFTGQDADAIVHNLTTNEIKSLEIDQGCETFVTDVRGKTLAHVFLFRLDDRLRMIGPHGFSQRIAEHADRYTIREDATSTIRDEEYSPIVVPPDVASRVLGEDSALANASSQMLRRTAISIAGSEIDAYRVRWLGEGTLTLMVPAVISDVVSAELRQQEIELSDADAFHQARTVAGFPWYGVDLDESNLPQEADRDAHSISFTKGCYLGQETVARLDALGQVQRKLVRWSFDQSAAEAVVPGATLKSDEKKVGRLTSVASLSDGKIVAIGFARRSHFDAGSEAKGTDEESGKVFMGRVID